MLANDYCFGFWISVFTPSCVIDLSFLPEDLDQFSLFSWLVCMGILCLHG